MQCRSERGSPRTIWKATEANRKASESVGDMHTPEWLEATKETRQACKTALAALKLHIREHKGLTLMSAFANR